MKIQRAIAMIALPAATLSFVPAAVAQEEAIEEVVVTGIRGSLANSIAEKRNSDNLIEAIYAEDIGKLPDQNLAEVLENVTGIQITREAGVGTGVQIRGTNANRTEINGVSTVGSGAGRSGIDFDDVSAAIISGVEVTKASEAKTIEGSVGGTINLKTIRPLQLTEPLIAARIQGEDSSLSTESGLSPRISGTFGSNWDTDFGSFGAVASLSYAESDVSSFRPRADRDNSIFSDSGAASAQTFDFLPIQFFVQDYDNFEYETTNFAGSLEWAPNDSVRLFFDAIINDQSRLQESSRIQASGISGLNGVAAPDSFETVNFGSLSGRNGTQNLGSIAAALTGVIPLDADGSDGNLRMSSDTGSRDTQATLFRFGIDGQITDRLSGRVEVASTFSDTSTSGVSGDDTINTTINFINPNSPLDAAQLLANHQANEAAFAQWVADGNDPDDFTEPFYDSNENGTPFEYDLRGGSLAFGVAQGAQFGPTTEQLLDPANYVLRDVNIASDTVENSEDAIRFDFTYDMEPEGDGITSIDFGYRFSKSTSLNDDKRVNVGLREFADSPTGDLFSEILVPGPTNFGEADGRDLFVRDFLVIDPQLINSNPGRVIDVLNEAIVANNAITGVNRAPISQPTSQVDAFFDIEEETDAFYLQANYVVGIFRGNVGVRRVETNVRSVGNSVTNGVATPTTNTGSYEFWLPRINVVADVAEDVVLRFGVGKDIRRPDFDNLSTSVTFSTSPNPPVETGNPSLVPEEVTSVDLSAEWYFAPGSVLSVGLFHKERTGLFVRTQEDPFEDPGTGYRDISAPCEQGGIFNPIADINVFGPNPGVGVCVPIARTINGAGETTQRGIEIAFQYDLAEWEDRLGWASGFGFVTNYTKQEFSGSDEFLEPTSRADTIFTRLGNPDVTLRAQLLDLSENSYNFTLYYEKYGISARMRYTWREAYRSDDFGSTSSFPWGFPVVQEDRGQLNASVTYDINDNFNIGIEGVNLAEEEVQQSCVNEGALLCFQGLIDRRITIGASYRF